MAGPIVVAIDLSDVSRRAVEHAARLAKEREVPLVVVHAIQRLPRVPAYAMSLGASEDERSRMEREAAARDAQHVCDEFVEPLRQEGLDVHLEVADEPPEDLIVRTAEAQHAQLIVMGSHGWMGFKRFVLGSVSQSVLHAATVPILVVPVSR